MSQAGFDGDRVSRVCPSRKEGLFHVTSQEVPPRVVGARYQVGARVRSADRAVARDLGVPAESLRRYVRQVEANEGLRPDLPTAAEREEIKALRKEVFELRRANEILKAASVFFATALDADRTR